MQRHMEPLNPAGAIPKELKTRVRQPWEVASPSGAMKLPPALLSSGPVP